MPTLHQTFIDIAQILDDDSDKDLLKLKLSNSNYETTKFNTNNKCFIFFL